MPMLFWPVSMGLGIGYECVDSTQSLFLVGVVVRLASRRLSSGLQVCLRRTAWSRGGGISNGIVQHEGYSNDTEYLPHRMFPTMLSTLSLFEGPSRSDSFLA